MQIFENSFSFYLILIFLSIYTYLVTVATPRTKYVPGLLSGRLSGGSFLLFLESYSIIWTFLFLSFFFFVIKEQKKGFLPFFSWQKKGLTLSIQHPISHYAWISIFSHPHFKQGLPVCSLQSQRSALCQVKGRHQLFVKTLQFMYSTSLCSISSTVSGTAL